MMLEADVKCYHCGHISGQVQGTRTDRLVIHTFKPRPDYRGPLPEAGQRIRCERCRGPVFLEDIRPLPIAAMPIPLRRTRKPGRPSRKKAA